MAQHISAKKLQQTPHVINSTKNKPSSKHDVPSQTNVNRSTRKTTNSAKNDTNGTANNTGGTAKNTVNIALKRRAQALLKDISVDGPSRSIIRYALETNDPWRPELVRRAGKGELNIETLDFSQRPPGEDDQNQEKIAALTERICRAG